MKELSHAARAVTASTTLAIDSMFKQMKAEGQDVLGFAAGEPDFNTPDHIKAAAVEALSRNQTRYTPAAGIMELRRAVCHRVREDIGLTYAPEQIVVASGAKHNVYIALRALINPGDEVILPAPYWVSYLELIRMAGGVPVVLNTTEGENFLLTPERLEAAVTPRTKAIILNNPSNPTGMMYDAAQLEAIGAVCLKHDLYVISDEIYDKLVYDGRKFTSFASLGDEIKERTILINGVSKSYAMTGWRIGYAAANPEIAKTMGNYVSHSTGAPSSISQWAAVAALTGPQGEIAAMREEFQRRRDYMAARINAIPGVSCLMPQGAFYVMMNVSRLFGKTVGGAKIETAEGFAGAFLQQGLVALVPGEGFGAPEFVRWSYAASMDSIQKGMDRLEDFLR